MTKISDSKLTSLEEILKEGAKNVSTDKLYWGLTNEAHQMEYEVEALADKTEAKARVLAEGLMNKNNTFEEALKELKRLNDLRNDITNEEIRQNITQILDITQSIIFKEMQQVRCDIRKFNNEDEAIKNTDGDNVMGTYKDGILVKGELKIQKQEHETEVINYLPSANIKCNLAPEFIEQITKEVIKKMKEDHINFAEVKQPCKAISMNDNKITSKAGSSVIMDEKGVVTAKVGDTSVTTIKEGIIGKVDNEISNTEDIESNKEKGPETSPITVNIKIPEIIQELINSYVESLETMSKAMKEAEEKANCEIEALKGEVNLLKAENDKLKEELKNDEEIDTKFFKEVSRYFKECKGEELEKIYDREQAVLAKMGKILKETNTERATVLLNVLIKIIPALSIIK